jgi:lipopolysaccharide/colanic/teichoic acid biosynthesis glycosyltransferase
MSTMNIGLARPAGNLPSAPLLRAKSTPRNSNAASPNLWRSVLSTSPLIVADIASLAASVACATLIVHALGLSTLSPPSLIALTATWLVSNVLIGLYPSCGLHPVVELRLLCVTNTISLVAAAMWIGLATSHPHSLLLLLAMVWLMNFLLAPPARGALRAVVDRLLQSPQSMAGPRGRMSAPATPHPLNLLWPSIEKRLIDVALAVTVAILFLPCILVIAVALKTTSPGPLFYSQRRIGRGGRHFYAWKFRTMVCDADAVLKTYLQANPQARKEWERDHKLKQDPRVTWIGRLLRQTSLDELPQLWNVLRGEMSLVGPRPIVNDEIRKYGEVFLEYTRVLPGITGLWQVSGRNNTTYDERVSLDAYYVGNWSVWLDLHILFRTIRVVLLREGAY